MCGSCDFLLKPLPPHSAENCPLLLRCAYCSTCGVYNAHFDSQCPKRAIGRLPANAHLSPSWSNDNIKPTRPDSDDKEKPKLPVFRILDDEETYKEYCITHNLTTPHGPKAAVYEHLLERGFRAETYEKGLDEYILPPPFEESLEPVKVVPMKRKLRKSMT